MTYIYIFQIKSFFFIIPKLFNFGVNNLALSNIYIKLFKSFFFFLIYFCFQVLFFIKTSPSHFLMNLEFHEKNGEPKFFILNI